MGLALSKSSNNFEIGRHEDICSHCTSTMAPSDRAEQVGKLTGQRIYKNTTPYGATFCLCEDCIKEIAVGTRQ